MYDASHNTYKKDLDPNLSALSKFATGVGAITHLGLATISSITELAWIGERAGFGNMLKTLPKAFDYSIKGTRRGLAGKYVQPGEGAQAMATLGFNLDPRINERLDQIFSTDHNMVVNMSAEEERNFWLTHAEAFMYPRLNIEGGDKFSEVYKKHEIARYKVNVYAHQVKAELGLNPAKPLDVMVHETNLQYRTRWPDKTPVKKAGDKGNPPGQEEKMLETPEKSAKEPTDRHNIASNKSSIRAMVIRRTGFEGTEKAKSAKGWLNYRGDPPRNAQLWYGIDENSPSGIGERHRDFYSRYLGGLEISGDSYGKNLMQWVVTQAGERRSRPLALNAQHEHKQHHNTSNSSKITRFLGVSNQWPVHPK